MKENNIYLSKLLIYCNNHDTITGKQLKQDDRGLYNKITHSCHGVINALKEIGMSHKLSTILPTLETQKEWIEYVTDVYKRYGKVTMKIMQQDHKYSMANLRKINVSIEQLLLAANVPLTLGQRKMISKDELNEEIKRLNRVFGYVSKPLMEKHSHINPKVVQRIYGSFSNMYKELNILRSPSGRIPTDEELIADARRIYNKYGFISKQIIKQESCYSATCYHDRLGGISGICDILNIPRQMPGTAKTALYIIKKYESYLQESATKEQTFDWLINPSTGKHLYLDAYFPQHNIALEYNGPQHYMIDRRYTTTKEQLEHRQYLDQLKQNLLQEHGVKIIVIHYKDIVNDNYIQKSLKI